MRKFAADAAVRPVLHRRRFRFGSSVAQWPQRQMRAGARLLLHYCNGEATWQLNPGGEVAPKSALNVIKRIDICAVGDCLRGSRLPNVSLY